MNTAHTLALLLLFPFVMSCSDTTPEEKGFSIAEEAEEDTTTKADGLSSDSLKLPTRPGNVLLTGIPEFRLTPVYTLNYSKNKERRYIGSNSFYTNYTDFSQENGNQWHYNFMPGLAAAYGYNMVNVSHYNISSQKQRELFDTPVLVKTLYYPAFTSDTLNFAPVKRDYYMISVYDEDTNGDRYINEKDLRRFYYFDINAENKKLLVPKNYSVLRSEYDSANDFMYVIAQLDANNNGKREEEEAIHIFWIDLKNPQNTGRQY